MSEHLSPDSPRWERAVAHHWGLIPEEEREELRAMVREHMGARHPAWIDVWAAYVSFDPGKYRFLVG